MDMTPKEYIEMIDQKFEEAAKKKMSRFDPEWGIWSHEMNREMRLRIEKEDPEEMRLKYVFVYWLLTSQLLELLSSGKKFIGRKKRLRTDAERKDIKDIILEDLNMDPWGLENDKTPFLKALSMEKR